MLTLRERVLVLFATAPEGFAMTQSELQRKFACNKRNLCTAIGRLVARQVLQRANGKLIGAGPALAQELGADE